MIDKDDLIWGLEFFIAIFFAVFFLVFFFSDSSLKYNVLLSLIPSILFSSFYFLGVIGLNRMY